MVALGNWDRASNYKNIFSFSEYYFPNYNNSKNRFYSFNIDQTHFIILDTYELYINSTNET